MKYNLRINKRPNKLLICLLGLFISVYAQAQLCTGSLGDPVVNITFGSGFPAGSPLSAATTSYNYISEDCPNDGSYAIRSSTTNCFGTWHTLTKDHTGNPQGCFMLVNASFAPGDFYVETVKGLCSNTTYEFASWVINMVRVANQIKPSLTFTIEKTDGTVLGKFNTGDINDSGTPQWKQYGFNFTTPPGTFEVVLRIRNNAPGGMGNDLALDDITFRPCGPLLSNVFAGNNDTVNICEGDVRTFDLAVSIPPFFTNPAYQWQSSTNRGQTWNDIAGATELTHAVTPSLLGSNWYRITVAELENFAFRTCRVASNITAINIHSLPIVNAGPDKVILKGDKTTLQGSVNDPALSIVWSPADFIDDNSKLQTEASPDGDISYKLSAYSSFGCSANDEVFIRVINGIHIPTSFTPNGDGLNDSWRIPYIEAVPGSEVKIFNRNGELIYQAKNGSVAWDGTVKGKPQPTGIYIYVIQLRANEPLLKGFITLIR